MINRKIIILDNDIDYITPLAEDLQKEGIQTILWDEKSDILEFIRKTKPDLIISEVHLQNMHGHELFKRLKSLPEFKNTPFVFISNQKNVDERIKHIEIGVDDFIPKPFHIQETVSRIKNLLREISSVGGYQAETEGGFTGTLAEMNLIDLIQTLELGKKSAVIKLKHQNQIGEVYISDGNVINARLNQLDGEAALISMFTWTVGYFLVEMTNVTETRRITKTNKELLEIGIRRLDAWHQIRQGLPPLQAVITPVARNNFDELSEEEKQLYQTLPRKIRLFDLIAKSQLDELKVLELTRSLYQKGYIQETDENYSYYVDEYLNRIKHNNSNYQSASERVAALVANFLKKNPEELNFPERREGERRQMPDRRMHSRRRTDKSRESSPIYLSKIELLMIKEALS